jgi:IclR family pca regulon transcriptional regulator
MNVVRMVNRTDFIASLAKGLTVIEAFRAESPRLSITDVAEATGLDRATARRCLLTLHTLGYADYDGKFFQLTPRVLRLGMGALAALPLPQIVQPWLDQLSERTGVSSSVSLLDDTHIVYVARAAKRRVMSIGLMPGSRLPAHCTSMGRVLLPARARSPRHRRSFGPVAAHPFQRDRSRRDHGPHRAGARAGPLPDRPGGRTGPALDRRSGARFA